MLVRKTLEPTSPKRSKIVPIRGYARQLESLYARRSTVEELIQSLENYQRFRAQRQEIQKSKTA
jgi:hypothetical protein